jgi:DNA-binding PadR family transcriptional regulator
MTTRARHEASLLILAVLASGSQHASGIVTGVRDISGGRVRLRAGSWYTALDHPRAGGLVAVDPEEIVQNRLRRYYRPIPAQVRRLPAPAPALVPALEPRPDLRIGDAEREATAAALGEHFAHGRLTFDELLSRLEAVFTATTHGEMTRTTRDLPA